MYIDVHVDIFAWFNGVFKVIVYVGMHIDVHVDIFAWYNGVFKVIGVSSERIPLIRSFVICVFEKQTVL